MGSPHALVLPYPAQGHVIPLMELSHCLVERGFKVTFVNTEFNHDRVVAALSCKGGEMGRIRLVSIPDGLGPGEDRNDLGKLTESFVRIMPGCLEELIRKTKESGDDKITCLIADESMAWALEVAKKMSLRAAAFWSAPAGVLASILSIPKLIEDGVIDANGVLLKNQELIQPDPSIPHLNPAYFVWNCLGDSKTGQIIFHYMLNNIQATEIAEFIICNSFHDIESSVFTLSPPNLLPVGPLLTGQQSEKPVGHFWPEDKTCTSWLDEQPANSVIYVAFGSFTVFDQRQFQELALGLELTGRPFLWVVRPDLTDGASDAYPDGFRDRVTNRGRMVGWAPQQKLLAHPSIACFLSHCGWNSTMEGVSNGVPFLCWPYFADQFLNQSYICDVWRIGLKMKPDESGIISREQIREKVEELVGDKEIRARAQVLKELAKKNVSEGGSSFENLNRFVDAMKE